MSPRPDSKTREAGREQIARLKAARDEQHRLADEAKAKADAEMWKAIADLIDADQVLQSDAASATGFSRDHVAKRTALHRQ